MCERKCLQSLKRTGSQEAGAPGGQEAPAAGAGN